MEKKTTHDATTTGEGASPGTFFVNKVLSTLLLLGLLLVVMGMSWIASPDPFLVLVGRSMPIIILIASLMVITASGANTISRFLVATGLTIGWVVQIFFMDMAFWGALYIMASLAVWFDFCITIVGCRSPLVLNSTSSFTVFIILFSSAFAIGFLFEFLNATVIHAWDITAMGSYYPIIEVWGVNLLIVFNWAIVGIVIFECMLLAFFAGKKKEGKETACSLGIA